jgi:predicted PurR-regulated permease PerM
MNLSPTPKQAGILWFALTALGVAVVIGLIAALCWGLGRILNLLSPVLLPLAIAGVVACVLSPVVDFFERRKMSRTRAIIAVFAVALALVLGVLTNVIPQVVVETQDLAAKVPAYSQKIQDRVNVLMAHPPALLQRFLPVPESTNAPDMSGAGTNPPNLQKPVDSVTAWVTDHLAGFGSWLLAELGRVLSGFGLLAGLVLVPVYAFHFLVEKRGIESHWREYVPLRDSAAKDEVIFMLKAIGQYLVAFFRGQLLIAVCDSILYTAGFLLIGLNYTFLLGCAAVLLIMIPFLGAIIICTTALLLAFVQYGDWLHPLLVLGVFAVVQTLDGLIISPKIMGNRVGLHPVVIIIAVMTGTTLLGGILGGVLAIPLAAALRVILHRYVWKEKEAEAIKN